MDCYLEKQSMRYTFVHFADDRLLFLFRLELYSMNMDIPRSAKDTQMRLSARPNRPKLSDGADRTPDRRPVNWPDGTEPRPERFPNHWPDETDPESDHRPNPHL